MDRFFIEQDTEKGFKIAAIDRNRIFASKNPGPLATVFEHSFQTLNREGDAQIFYALAPSIGADRFFADFNETHRSQRLNSWSISIVNRDVANLFQALTSLTRTDRLEMYGRKNSITPASTVTSDSYSLFSLVAFAEQQAWKTGILQKCVDCLVNVEHRGKAIVYAVIDEQYRRLMRFKLETETEVPKDIIGCTFVMFIKRILTKLGLQNSHDTTPFTTISGDVEAIFKVFEQMSAHKFNGTLVERLSQVLTVWSGASIKILDVGYQIEVDPAVTEGLNYMQPWLPIPEILQILEDPL
ncbi:Hypothetical protein HVR_LOCUS528 [uncultured virus]|nr:Hypothetical protein HVR_LOCUS528 [uncultured virus]